MNLKEIKHRAVESRYRYNVARNARYARLKDAGFTSGEARLLAQHSDNEVKEAIREKGRKGHN